jgi:hypothetical protein
MARVRGGGTCRASAARRGRGRPPGSGRREHDAENPEVVDPILPFLLFFLVSILVFLCSVLFCSVLFSPNIFLDALIHVEVLQVATMAARRGRGRPPGSRSREHDAEQPSQHILQPVQSIPESSSQHIPEHVLQPHQSHEAHIPAQAPAGRQSNIHIFTDPPQPNRGSNVRPRSPSVVSSFH